jgi:hypothetical protein
MLFTESDAIFFKAHVVPRIESVLRVDPIHHPDQLTVTPPSSPTLIFLTRYLLLHRRY